MILSHTCKDVQFFVQTELTKDIAADCVVGENCTQVLWVMWLKVCSVSELAVPAPPTCSLVKRGRVTTVYAINT